MSKERAEISRRLYTSLGDTAHLIDIFGDTLAERHGYRELKGIDAVHYYLVQKHNWFPSQVKSLCTEDLAFLLAEDMAGWRFPTDKATVRD